MNASPCYFYGDARSLKALHSRGPHVLLLGSYQGCSNFGDILQLKGAIAWHREHTRLEPVVFVNAYSLASSDYLERLRGWFGTEAVVLWSEEHLDAAPHGLTVITNPPVIAHLHLYGGGFLNSYWGERMLALTEAIHGVFGVGHYVISGQQVEAGIAPRLTQHVQRCRPILAGGRDPASAEVLAACGAKALFSFDDAAEAVRDLAARTRLAADPGSGLALHLNASGYTARDSNGETARLDKLIADLARVVEHLRRPGCPESGLTLLNVCSDGRVHDIKDSLSVLLELEDRFPFKSYRVLDLARAALEYGTPESGASLDLSAGLGLVCSYHTAMFCGLAGLPVYLVSSNEYYRQKRDGLKMSAGLEQFLQCPRVPSFSSHFEARSAWLAELEKAYAQPPCEARPTLQVATDKPATAWPYRHSHWGELRQMTATHATLLSHVQELTAARDNLWTELQKAKAYADELAAARDLLWADLCEAQRQQRHAGMRAAAFQAENDLLRESLGRLRCQFEQQRFELEQQRLQCEQQRAALDEWGGFIKHLEQTIANCEREIAKSPFLRVKRWLYEAMKRRGWRK